MNKYLAMSKTEDKMEPYSGKDPNLHEEPYCIKCCERSKETKPLLRCSVCKLVFYCSEAHQKEDLSEHMKFCKYIGKLTDLIEKQAAALQRQYECVGRKKKRVNLFDVSVGNFWGIYNTRGYMEARMMLADVIHDCIASDYGTKESFETVLRHYQDMLRLCSSDNLNLRFRFPYLLINVNRDDDAFDFIRYWMKADSNNETNREQSHADSVEGDWLYGHQEDCRFLDIFQECPDANLKYTDIAHLVALACIKMRLVAADKASIKSMEHFQLSAGGEALSAVQSIVSENVIGDADFRAKMEAQQAQLNRLLDLIHERNASMLPALLNPNPLRSQPSPEYLRSGSPSECHPILNDACRVWARIPGALEVLEGRFGRNPTYDFNMERRRNT